MPGIKNNTKHRPVEGERALTRKQAAEISTYSEKTLANLAVLGVGPPFRKYRGKVIYLERELHAWLRNLPCGGSGSALLDRTAGETVHQTDTVRDYESRTGLNDVPIRSGMGRRDWTVRRSE